MRDLPTGIAALVATLAAVPGAVAVALGGSRATGDADAGSDWDLALYYRRVPELALLARYGEVHPPGAWGRIMNGGAWLTVDGARVDVLLRDLDVVERFADAARRGEFDVDALLGYVAGIPTYSVLAELALGRPLTGTLPGAIGFPPALAATAPPRWRFCARFSLDHARMRAQRGDIVGTVGQGAKAVVEAAHAIVCARGEWTLNEKRLVERAGLSGLQASFLRVPVEPGALSAWVDGLRIALDASFGGP